MKRLVLLRHGDAERARPGQSDFDRALSEEGREEAARLGKALVHAGAASVRALVSAAKRTLQTWDGVGAAFPDAPAQVSREIYDGTAQRIQDLIESAHEDDATLIVVGHNPTIHLLALRYARRALPDAGADGLARGFPTGSAAVFVYDERGPVLERMITARSLRGA